MLALTNARNCGNMILRLQLQGFRSVTLPCVFQKISAPRGMAFAAALEKRTSSGQHPTSISPNALLFQRLQELETTSSPTLESLVEFMDDVMRIASLGVRGKEFVTLTRILRGISNQASRTNRPVTQRLKQYFAGAKSATFLNWWYDNALQRIADFDAPSLSSVLYSHAQLQLMPRADVLSELYAVCEDRVRQFQPPTHSSLLYAHALLNLAPPQAFLDGWFEAAVALLGIYEVGQLHKILHSLYLLRVKPPNAFMDKVAAVLLKKIPNCSCNDLVALMRSLAKLGISSDAALIKRLLRAFQKVMKQAKPAELADCICAMALFNVDGNPIDRGMLKTVASSQPLDSLASTMPDGKLHALYIAMQYFDLPVGDNMDELIKELQFVRAANADNIHTSFLQRDCIDYLFSMQSEFGYEVHQELWNDAIASRVDVVLERHKPNRRKLYIQIDGPSHFLKPQMKLTPETLLQTAVLRKSGHAVRHIAYFDWQAMQENNEKREFIRNLLQEAEFIHLPASTT